MYDLGNLDLYGNNLTLTGLYGTGCVTDTRLLDATDTLTLSPTGTDAFNGTITDGTVRQMSVNITSGNMLFLNTQAYTAGTTIAPTACAAFFQGSGNLYGTISDGGNLWFAPTGGNMNVGGVISGAGTVFVYGAGQVTLLGSNTYTGNTTIFDGTVNVGATWNSTTSTGPFGTGSLVLDEQRLDVLRRPGRPLDPEPGVHRRCATTWANVSLGNATAAESGNLVFANTVEITGCNACLTILSPVFINGNLTDDTGNRQLSKAGSLVPGAGRHQHLRRQYQPVGRHGHGRQQQFAQHGNHLLRRRSPTSNSAQAVTITNPFIISASTTLGNNLLTTAGNLANASVIGTGSNPYSGYNMGVENTGCLTFTGPGAVVDHGRPRR